MLRHREQNPENISVLHDGSKGISRTIQNIFSIRWFHSSSLTILRDSQLYPVWSVNKKLKVRETMWSQYSQSCPTNSWLLDIAVLYCGVLTEF